MAGNGNGGGGQAWQPTYPVWAPAVLASTFAAALATPRLALLVAGRAVATPLEAALALGDSAAGGLVVAAMATVAMAVPPGLLSLFLITLTDARLRLHPAIGAAVFGTVAGLMGQTLAAAAFGFFFGLISLGGTAAALALHRHVHRRASANRRRG